MGARHFYLTSAGTQAGEIRHCISSVIRLSEEKDTTWVTVTRTGRFTDPRYGVFDITRSMLQEMVRNFEADTYGQKIFIDISHKPADGAAGEVLKLAVEGDRLRAQVKWTPFGREAIRARGLTARARCLKPHSFRWCGLFRRSICRGRHRVCRKTRSR